MQKIIFLTFITISIILSARIVKTDEAADLKLEKDKFAEAQKACVEIIEKMKSDYIQSFATLLAKGVTELEARTQSELKTETDATKRKDIIAFATASYDRLLKFIHEVELNLPDSLKETV